MSLARRRTRARRGEQGFTLVESITAIVILMVGLVAVANLMLVSTTSTTVANHMTATSAEASRVMDMLKTIPWEDLRCTRATSLTADLPSTNSTSSLTTTAGVLNTANIYSDVRGIGRIRTRYRVVNVDRHTRYITVQSESMGRVATGKAQATFTSLRVCAVRIPDAAGNPRCKDVTTETCL